MVRATAAEIKKLFHGSWPSGADDTSVGNLLAGIDYKLDGFVKKYYEAALSTTDTTVIHIANMLGKQEVLRGLWANAGGAANPELGAEPALFTQEIIDLIEAVISDTTRDGVSWFALDGQYST